MTKHGTVVGYTKGKCREACCREAMAEYEYRRVIDRYLNGPRLVPAVGTRRRLQALGCMGWTSRDIAAAIGSSHVQRVQQLRRANRATVHRTSAQAVAEAYRRMSTVRGPSNLTATRALSYGWLPPLAWDDIDDPNEQPNVSAIGRTPQKRAADLLEDAVHLLAYRVPMPTVAERLGVKVGTIRDRLRAGAATDPRVARLIRELEVDNAWGGAA